MKQNHQWHEYTMGTCYYPEHWPSPLWSEDLDRMLAAGITRIRIGEFAWNKVEPTEGVFTDSFFRPFLDLCAEKGMKVIFGTPTATPPAWLTEKYPEVLNARMDGVLYRHGCRRHYNYNSPVYRELSARVVEYVGSQFGPHPAVEGWQIDNELNCETDLFFSEADDCAFRAYLQEKFVTLDALNEALGTVFWNQTYTNWNEIHLPRPTVSNGPNPHMMLEYSRFISRSTISFCAMQSDILRKYLKPGDFITTNGLFGHVDNVAMTERALDVYTYDIYPDFYYSLENRPDPKDPPERKTAGSLSEVRGICPHFGIMEQQSGGNGWVTRMEAPMPRPGQLSLWAMQSVAYGADMVSFFRWRTSPVGTEIYWHGILEQDNRINRKLIEVTAFGRDLKKINAVVGADVVAGFALLKDYDNDWDLRVDKRQRLVTEHSINGILEASLARGITYDTVFVDHAAAEDLFKYPVVILPHDMIATPQRTEMLKAYVEQGGTLVLGCCSGTKDEYGKCPLTPVPGLFRELTGSEVIDFTYTSPAEPPVTVFMKGRSLPADIYMEVLAPGKYTTAIAEYENTYAAGTPAATCHILGKGRVIHWGTTFSKEAVLGLMDLLELRAPWEDLLSVPTSVTVVVREKEGHRYLFVLNYLNETVKPELKQPMTLLTGEGGTVTTLTLPPFGTAVLEV